MRCWIKSEPNIVVIICIVLIAHPYIFNTLSLVWLHVCSMEGFAEESLIRLCGFLIRVLFHLS